MNLMNISSKLGIDKLRWRKWWHIRIGGARNEAADVWWCQYRAQYIVKL